jgi:hypothetical protein
MQYIGCLYIYPRLPYLIRYQIQKISCPLAYQYDELPDYDKRLIEHIDTKKYKIGGEEAGVLEKKTT